MSPILPFQDVDTASEPIGMLIPEPAVRLNSLLKPTLLAQSQQKEVKGLSCWVSINDSETRRVVDLNMNPRKNSKFLRMLNVLDTFRGKGMPCSSVTLLRKLL